MTTPNLIDIKRGKKDSVESFVTKAMEDHRSRMSSIYRQWAIQLAWTRGHQNVDFDLKTRKWVSKARESWRARLSTNLMLPLVRHTVSRIMQSRPIWDVVPATPDEEDIQIANVSSKVCKDLWVRQDMDIKALRTLFWMCTTGNAFMRVGWDSEEGDEVKVKTLNIERELIERFIEVLGITAAEVPEEFSLNAGECYIEPVTPFNMACDPLSNIFEDSLWAIESELRSIDWICNKFGNKWKDKLSTTHDVEIFLYPYIYNENTVTPKEGVVTYSLYLKKSQRFKDGLYCFIADNKILDGPRPNPYEHGDTPYGHFLEIYDPASVWGTCSAEQIRPDQAQYNNVKSNITDHFNKVSRIQWLNPMNSGVTAITNRPGEIINYKFPFKPEQTQPKPLPAYVERMLERTRRDMQDTSSYHNVSQGQNDPGVRSAKAVLALQDADDTVLGPTILWFNRSLERIGRLALQTIAQYTTDDRTVSIVGEYNEQEILSYTRDDLVGNSPGDYFNVRVKTSSHQAMSRISREQQMLGLIEMGVLDPKRDRLTILGFIGLADSMSLFEEYASDRTRQWNEIQAMIAGQQINPTEGENHEVHIKTIKKFIASSKRNKIDPNILKIIQQHMDGHYQLQALEVAKQMSYMQLAQAVLSGGLGAKENDQTAVRSGGTRGPGPGDRRTGNPGRTNGRQTARTRD